MPLFPYRTCCSPASHLLAPISVPWEKFVFYLINVFYPWWIVLWSVFTLNWSGACSRQFDHWFFCSSCLVSSFTHLILLFSFISCFELDCGPCEDPKFLIRNQRGWPLSEVRFNAGPTQSSRVDNAMSPIERGIAMLPKEATLQRDQPVRMSVLSTL